MHHAMTRRLLYVEYEIEILGHYSFCKLISNNFINSITENHIIEFIGLYQFAELIIVYIILEFKHEHSSANSIWSFS